MIARVERPPSATPDDAAEVFWAKAGLALLLQIFWETPPILVGQSRRGRQAVPNFNKGPLPEDNIYDWYEGESLDYPNPDGGCLNNGSSGFTPRFWDERVRQLFISSATEFVAEFHVDGLRVDLTQAIRRDNSLNANGWGVARANLFGQKLLREWSRTLRLIRPSVMLIAEDHSGWDAVTRMPNVGGRGSRPSHRHHS